MAPQPWISYLIAKPVSFPVSSAELLRNSHKSGRISVRSHRVENSTEATMRSGVIVMENVRIVKKKMKATEMQCLLCRYC